MNILPVEDRTAYENLAVKCGSIFNSKKWQAIFGNALQLYGIYDNGNYLVGGFHLYTFKKYGLNCICNPPFNPGIGLFFVNQTTNRSSDASFTKEIINLLASFLAKLNCSLIEIALPHSIVDTQPFQWKNFSVSPKYTYILNLNEDVNCLWDHFSSQRRKSIRKAENDKLIVKKVTNFNETRTLIEKTFNRQNKKINLQVLDNILNIFADESNSFAFVAYADKRPIAVTFCLFDSHSAYYILGGYDEKFKHHGAGAITMWEAIQYAKKMGLRNFDFEGSMIPSVEEYFREFGGRLTPFYKISRTAWPLKLLKKLNLVS